MPRPTPARCATPASASAVTTTTTWKPSPNGPASCSPICRTKAAVPPLPTISSPATPMSRYSTPQARWAWSRPGQVRALAVMSDQRVPEYADVPTLTELGYANAKGLWSALYAPAATPRDVLEIVRKAAVQALNSEQVATAFKQQMIRPLPSASIDEAQAWNKAEVAYWKKVTDEVKVELPD